MEEIFNILRKVENLIEAGGAITFEEKQKLHELINDAWNEKGNDYIISLIEKLEALELVDDSFIDDELLNDSKLKSENKIK